MFFGLFIGNFIILWAETLRITRARFSKLLIFWKFSILFFSGNLWSSSKIFFCFFLEIFGFLFFKTKMSTVEKFWFFWSFSRNFKDFPNIIIYISPTVKSKVLRWWRVVFKSRDFWKLFFNLKIILL